MLQRHRAVPSTVTRGMCVKICIVTEVTGVYHEFCQLEVDPKAVMLGTVTASRCMQLDNAVRPHSLQAFIARAKGASTFQCALVQLKIRSAVQHLAPD